MRSSRRRRNQVALSCDEADQQPDAEEGDVIKLGGGGEGGVVEYHGHGIHGEDESRNDQEQLPRQHQHHRNPFQGQVRGTPIGQEQLRRTGQSRSTGSTWPPDVQVAPSSPPHLQFQGQHTDGRAPESFQSLPFQEHVRDVVGDGDGRSGALSLVQGPPEGKNAKQARQQQQILHHHHHHQIHSDPHSGLSQAHQAAHFDLAQHNFARPGHPLNLESFGSEFRAHGHHPPLRAEGETGGSGQEWREGGGGAEEGDGDDQDQHLGRHQHQQQPSTPGSSLTGTDTLPPSSQSSQFLSLPLGAECATGSAFVTGSGSASGLGGAAAPRNTEEDEDEGETSAEVPGGSLCHPHDPRLFPAQTTQAQFGLFAESQSRSLGQFVRGQGHVDVLTGAQPGETEAVEVSDFEVLQHQHRHQDQQRQHQHQQFRGQAAGHHEEHPRQLQQAIGQLHSLTGQLDTTAGAADGRSISTITRRSTQSDAFSGSSQDLAARNALRLEAVIPGGQGHQGPAAPCGRRASASISDDGSRPGSQAATARGGLLIGGQAEETETDPEASGQSQSQSQSQSQRKFQSTASTRYDGIPPSASATRGTGPTSSISATTKSAGKGTCTLTEAQRSTRRRRRGPESAASAREQAPVTGFAGGTFSFSLSHAHPDPNADAPGWDQGSQNYYANQNDPDSNFHQFHQFQQQRSSSFRDAPQPSPTTTTTQTQLSQLSQLQPHIQPQSRIPIQPQLRPPPHHQQQYHHQHQQQQQQHPHHHYQHHLHQTYPYRHAHLHPQSSSSSSSRLQHHQDSSFPRAYYPALPFSHSHHHPPPPWVVSQLPAGQQMPMMHPELSILNAESYDDTASSSFRAPRSLPPQQSPVADQGEDPSGDTPAGTKKRVAQRSTSVDEPDEPDKKRRGRPKLDTNDQTAQDRRRTQIRLAQRAYRNRKETAIQTLEKKVAELQTSNEQMCNAFMKLYDFTVNQGMLEAQPDFAQQLRSTAQTFVSLARNSTSEGGGKEGGGSSGDRPGLLDQGSDGRASSPGSGSEKQNTSFDAPGPSGGKRRRRRGQGRSSDAAESSWAQAGLAAASASSATSAAPAPSTSPYEIVTEPTPQNASFPFGTSYERDPVTAASFLKDTSSSSFVPRSSMFAGMAPSLPATLGQPTTFSFQERTFGRRMHRLALEQALLLLNMPDPPPNIYAAVFGFCLLFESRDRIVQRITNCLSVNQRETMYNWRFPFLHLGGAGTFFNELNDLNDYGLLADIRAKGAGVVDPASESDHHFAANTDIAGAQEDSHCASSSRAPRFVGNQGLQEPHRRHLTGQSMYGQGPWDPAVESVRDMRVDRKLRITTPGFEGDFYDCDEVEWYLQQQGVTIPPSADFITATISAAAFTDASFRHSEPKGFDTTIDKSVADWLTTGASDGFGSLLTPSRSPAATSSSTGVPPDPSVESLFAANAAGLVDPVFGQDGTAAFSFSEGVDGFGTVTVTIDVAQLVEGLALRSVCLGRTPGIRPKDINAAFWSSVS